MKKFTNSDFIRSVSVLVSGNVIAQIITLITMPIVSRIYSLQAFGEFAIFSSTASIVGGIAGLGMSSAIMAPKSNERSKEVVFTAFLSVILVSLLFLISTLILSPFLKLYKISIPYHIAAILMFLQIALTGLSSILSTYANRLKKNRLLFFNTLITASATLFITIPLGLFGWGVIGFISASLFAALIANIQMLVQINPFSRILNFKEITSTFYEFRDYVRFQFPANLLTNFSIQLPNQMFSATFGNIALGGYSMCERVMGYPIRLVAAPIATIYFRHATQLINDNKKEELGRFSLRLTNRILLAAFLPAVLFMGYASPLFSFVLGSKWGPAGEIAAILTIQYILVFNNQCLSYCLVVVNRQKTNLYISIAQLFLIFGSIMAGILIFKDLKWTILVFSMGNVLVQSIYLTLNFYYLNISPMKIMRTLFLFILGTLGMSALLHFKI
ncbi:MAG: oligosaccharide flippase family protein [Sphingobacteriia bacterium]|nr:oligosaccharide flippase family protein [Sphingobacteriia bacterium]